MRSGWGPRGCRGALSVTFDNLGEAAELEDGRWPAGRALGAHPSVTRALPRLLAALGALPATFFVEGWSCARYPDAVRAIAARGHEVACHGWRHERWADLGADDERTLLERALATMRGLDVAPRGFRPPGGRWTDATPRILKALGLTYGSPAGTRRRVDGGFVTVPFAWQAVDAYYFEPLLAPVRRALGDDAAPLAPARWRRELAALRDACLADGGHRVVILHPYLLDDDERLDALADFAAGLAARDDLWVAPCGAVAEGLAGGATG
jgi:peptidoglycan/xylan/chitin deacetylase (PgdA/CDA1 family)